MKYFQAISNENENVFDSCGNYEKEREKTIRGIINLLTPELRKYFESNQALLKDISEIRLRAGIVSSVTLSAFSKSKYSLFKSSGGMGFNEIIIDSEKRPLIITKDELDAVFSRLCQGSVYAQAESLKMGFAVKDSVRIGVGGRVNVRDGKVIGFSDIESLNIRIPVFSLASAEIMLSYIAQNGLSKTGGILAVSPPGGGKTTFLRALARSLSSGINCPDGKRKFRVCLADERGELYNEAFFKNCIVDRLEMCPKAYAVECATALLSPEVIVCDEIRSEAEADAICKAASRGVILAASCHGIGIEDVLKRPHMKKLAESGVFGTVYSLKCVNGGFGGEIKSIGECLC